MWDLLIEWWEQRAERAELKKFKVKYIASATITWNKHKNTDTLVYHLMVNGLGERKLRVQASSEQAEESYKHYDFYMKYIVPWLDGENPPEVLALEEKEW